MSIYDEVGLPEPLALDLPAIDAARTEVNRINALLLGIESRLSHREDRLADVTKRAFDLGQQFSAWLKAVGSEMSVIQRARS